MRSFMSSFAAFAIGASGYKKKVADPVRREKYIEKLRAKNEKPYKAPVFPYRTKPEEFNFDGTQVYRFNGKKSRKIIYLHGGAYCEQPLLPHFVFCDTIALKTDSEVLLPIYKKAPNYTFETTFEMLKRLYSELLADRDTEDILFMGDSSGGGLALAFCEYLNEIGLSQPKRMILISPWLDASMSTPFSSEFDKIDPSLQYDFLKRAGKNWAGDTDVRDYRISPIFGKLSSLAPMTVYYGTYEAIVTDARILKKKCEEVGADLDYREYEGMNHCFPIYPIPEAKKAQKEIIGIINSGK